MTNLAIHRKDFQAIVATLQHYIDGAVTGESARMRLAFHPDATIFGYDESGLFAGSMQKLFDWTDDTGPAPDMEAEIVSIEIAATVATARLELYDWDDLRFTDFMTLLKVGSEWKIVNKVFHQHE